MWIILALVSALCLGVYDIFKKASLKGNDVPVVLMLNTVFGTILLSPFLLEGGLGCNLMPHLLMALKAAIVLSSWILGYFAIKHLPLTIQGPINATRPVVVLVGAVCIFGERLNPVQWAGVLLGFTSLYLISRVANKEGFRLRHSDGFMWMSIGAMVLGAISALYDKHLLRSYQPTDVQAWYSFYQCLMMCGTVGIMQLRKRHHAHRLTQTDTDGSRKDESSPGDSFQWRWTIPCISIFLTIADLAYFHALSSDGSMVSVVSMIRRGSVLVSFLYGIVVLHEKHIRAKLLDLSILLISLALLVLGSAI